MRILRFIAMTLAGAYLTCAVAAKPLPRFKDAPKPTGTPRVVMVTNHGRIVIELYAEKAPISVKNFLQYVDDRFYDGMIFHRVIPDFVIQGGGFVPGFKEKPGRDPIKSEAGNGLTNKRGSIAVARMITPDSGTSQFYINTKDNQYLDKANNGYCVFGQVVEGMDVIDRIRRVPTGQKNGHSDVPLQDVLILSVRRVAN